ncbi:MAG: hypothetical protein Q7J38_13225 [Gallionella sp.]|nr:hypothetical protein [Gallionella sp.]
MPQPIEVSLRVLDVWYNEPSIGNDRTVLLSKLAILELCGWIEEAFDELIRGVDGSTINDSEWVHENVITKTSGFNYINHFRPMLVKLIGEVLTRRVEADMEQNHNGDLERMKVLLGTLWKMRCKLAHANVAANVISQVKFDAPSVSIGQYLTLNKFIGSLEISIKNTLAKV